MKKIKIEKVSNGYIVRWLDHGDAALKVAYDPLVLVFGSLSEMMEYLTKEFRDYTGQE